MNPKSNKASIPLSAPLNLSKLNTEISSFSGWNDINSPYYGKCVSPIYEYSKTLDSSSAVFDSDGNAYIIGATSLTKNGTPIMSYNNSYFTDSTLDNYIAVAATSTGYIAIQETATLGTFNIISNETVSSTMSVYSSGKTICSKCLQSGTNQLYVIIYVVGTTYYYWLYNGISTTKTGTISWLSNTWITPLAWSGTPNNVRINAAYLNNYWMISILSDSGSGVTDLGYFNMTLAPDGSLFNTSWSFSGGPVLTKSTLVSESIGFYSTFYTTLKSGTGYAPALDNRTLGISLSSTYGKDIKVYVSDSSHMSQSTAVVASNLVGTITARSSSLSATVGDATYADGTVISTSLRQYVWISTTGTDKDNNTLNYVFMIPQSYNGYYTVYTTTTMTATAKEYSKTFTEYRATSISAVHTPDIVSDDGYFYCLCKFAYGDSAQGCIPLRCEYNSMTATTASTAISYTANSYYSWIWNTTSYNVLPKTHAGTVLDIGQGFIRITMRASLSSYDSKDPSDLSTDVIVLYDSASNKVLYNPGTLSTYRNNAGSLYQSNMFRLLYTNGVPSGVSYGDIGYRGTLLSEWYSVSSLFDFSSTSTSAIYKNAVDSKVHYIKVNSGIPTYQFVENRYIIINTTSFYNCYDIISETVLHYAEDWNNRALAGSTDPNDISSTVDSASMVTGVNLNYEASKVYITSIGINPQQLSLLIKDKETFISAAVPTSNNIFDIDVYYGSSTDAYAYYIFSARVSSTSSLRYVSAMLKGLYSPITSSSNILYSPNMFTTYIKSYSNNDMAVSNGTGYPLIYSGTTPVLAYYLLSGLDGVTDLFVIQSQFYAIVDSKIIKLTYNNGVIVSSSAISDVSGMQFIGALPERALFFSNMNRNIYSFTGDCLLTSLYEANKISIINSTYYNTATQSLYIATDVGLYIINSASMFRLPMTDISNVYFIGTSAIVISGTTATYLSYYNQTNYVKVPILLETQYYGAGSEMASKVDSWLIRLYNNGNPESGTITVNMTTLTDSGYMTDTKKFSVTTKDWDSTTNTLYIRYQPKYQNCVGASLLLSSTFAISSIVVNYTIDTEQISHFNI